MLRNITRTLTIGIMLVATTAAFAANPADLTSFQRWSGPFYTAARDKDSWFACATHPIGSVSTTYFHWQTDDKKTTRDQIFLVQSLNKQLDLAIDADVLKNGDLPYHQNVSIDWHSGQGNDGVGLMVPFQANQGLKLGLRKTAGQLTAYLTSNVRTAPTYGLTLSQKWGKIDIAYKERGWKTRLSKSMGRWTQEFRMDFAQSETALGFRMAYCPGD